MKDGVLNIRAGKQFATATQIPTEEAEVAAKKVAAYFNGQKMKKYELVPVHGITRENVGRFAAGCSY
jgi:ABC-type sugar transport system substrate-binding protein